MRRLGLSGLLFPGYVGGAEKGKRASEADFARRGANPPKTSYDLWHSLFLSWPQSTEESAGITI